MKKSSDPFSHSLEVKKETVRQRGEKGVVIYRDTGDLWNTAEVARACGAKIVGQCVSIRKLCGELKGTRVIKS